MNLVPRYDDPIARPTTLKVTGRPRKHLQTDGRHTIIRPVKDGRIKTPVACIERLTNANIWVI